MLLAEKETIITFDETNEPASVFTFNKALQNKLDKLCKDCPESVRLTDEHREGSKRYSIPKNWVRVIQPPKYTDADRARRAEVARQNFNK